MNRAESPSKTKKEQPTLQLFPGGEHKAHHHNKGGDVELPRRRNFLRSYLHKELDNWLVVRFDSVLRYRQRHSGRCYESFMKKSVLPRPTSLGPVVHVSTSPEPGGRSFSPVRGRAVDGPRVYVAAELTEGWGFATYNATYDAAWG